MANTPTVAYEKKGTNFKTSVFNVALTGNYAAPEVMTLTSATSNPAARTITGPAGAAKLPPRVELQNLPTVLGYNLVPTATAGQYNLTLVTASGVAFAGAYPANAAVIVEIDHDLQGY